MTFEDFLKEKFYDEYCGLDDEMPDAECDWFEALDINEVIVWAEEWHKKEIEKGNN